MLKFQPVAPPLQGGEALLQEGVGRAERAEFFFRVGEGELGEHLCFVFWALVCGVLVCVGGCPAPP